MSKRERDKDRGMVKEMERESSGGCRLETEKNYYRFQFTEMLLILLFIYYLLQALMKQYVYYLPIDRR